MHSVLSALSTFTLRSLVDCLPSHVASPAASLALSLFAFSSRKSRITHTLALALAPSPTPSCLTHTAAEGHEHKALFSLSFAPQRMPCILSLTHVHAVKIPFQQQFHLRLYSLSGHYSWLTMLCLSSWFLGMGFPNFAIGWVIWGDWVTSGWFLFTLCHWNGRRDTARSNFKLNIYENFSYISWIHWQKQNKLTYIYFITIYFFMYFYYSYFFNTYFSFNHHLQVIYNSNIFKI